MSDIKVIYEDHMGDDLAVVNAAKVSFGKRSDWVEDCPCGQPGDRECNQQCRFVLSKADIRLINFLARGCTQGDWDQIMVDACEMARDYTMGSGDDLSKILNQYRDQPIHKSPFNHCYVKFHVTAPIFVARQLVKHEYLPWNEISGRYVEFEADFFEPHTFRSKATDKKQGSGAAITNQAAVDLQGIFGDVHAFAYKKYKQALALGLCEEQARSLLPLDTMTQWIWSGSLGAWAKMCKLRLAPDAQYESRLVAKEIDETMSQLFPVAWAALMTNGQAQYQGTVAPIQLRGEL